VPSHDRGLLARLDALVELVADRHGLALLRGRLAAAEARVAARAAGLAAHREPTARAAGVTQREAVELLRAVAEGVGLLRVRGDRLEATSLRNPGPRSTNPSAPGLHLLPGAMACTGLGGAGVLAHAVRVAPIGGRWLASSWRDRALDKETSCSEPVSEVVHRRAGEHVLPIVVARLGVSRWKRAGQHGFACRGPGAHHDGQIASQQCRG
jgi:hypothetical protein